MLQRNDHNLFSHYFANSPTFQHFRTSPNASGNVGKCREMSGNVGKSRKKSVNVGGASGDRQVNCILAYVLSSPVTHFHRNWEWKKKTPYLRYKNRSIFQSFFASR